VIYLPHLDLVLDLTFDFSYEDFRKLCRTCMILTLSGLFEWQTCCRLELGFILRRNSCLMPAVGADYVVSVSNVGLAKK